MGRPARDLPACRLEMAASTTWKEIAAYLKRDATTVRRWEKREGLPVHRHLHDTRDSVYAYTKELDDWRQGRHNHLGDPRQSTGDTRSMPGTDRQAGPAPYGWRGLLPRSLGFPPSLWPWPIFATPRAILRSNGALFGYPSCRSRRLETSPFRRTGVSWRSSGEARETHRLLFVRSIR